jgi:hypothetical protein
VALVSNVHKPPWYQTIEWLDIGVVQRKALARQHEDVAETWLKMRAEVSDR